MKATTTPSAKSTIGVSAPILIHGQTFRACEFKGQTEPFLKRNRYFISVNNKVRMDVIALMLGNTLAEIKAELKSYALATDKDKLMKKLNKQFVMELNKA